MSSELGEIIIDPNQILKKHINIKYIDKTICKNPNPKTRLLLEKNKSLIRKDYLLNSDWGIDFLFDNNLIEQIPISILASINNNKIINYLLSNPKLSIDHTEILKNENKIICDIIICILDNKNIKEEYNKYDKAIEQIKKIIKEYYDVLFENKNINIVNYLFKKHFIDKNDTELYYNDSKEELFINDTEEIVNYIIENKITNINIIHNKNEKIIKYIIDNNYFNINDGILFKYFTNSNCTNINLVNNYLFYFFEEYKYDYYYYNRKLYKLYFSGCLENNEKLEKFVIENINYNLLDIYKTKDFSVIKLNYYKLTGNSELEDESFDYYWYNSYSKTTNSIGSYKLKIKLLFNENEQLDYDITKDDIYN